MKQIFATCDAVIVCCASTQETRSIINGGLLKRMKPQSILINTARGDIIVERDLVAFAKLRPDVRIAVDVVSGEENGAADYNLLRRAGMLVTHHVAGETVDSRTKAAKIVYSIVQEWLNAQKRDSR